MQKWQEVSLDLHKQGLSYKQIANYINNAFDGFEDIDETYQIIRRFIYKWNMRHGSSNETSTETAKQVNIYPDGKCIEQTPTHSTVEYKQDGTVISERLIQIIEARSKDVKYILEAHGFNSDEWDVVSCKNNIWSMSSSDEAKVNCQSKITVKPKAHVEAMLDIDVYMSKKNFASYKEPTHAYQYDEDGEYLEVCIPDLHGGLFAWRNETGEDYDLHIAKERFEQAMADVKHRCEGKKLAGIFFVTLGDLLNFDNEEQSTTKRTPQQSDGRTAKVHDLIMDMMIDAVTMLGDIAPVEVIYLPGNHDLVTGRMLMMAVKQAFRNDENIMWDMMPNPLKARRFGNVMVGWTHGDMPEKNMGTWLPQMARKDFGECTAVEVHAGHFHKQNTKEKSVTINNSNQTFEDGGVVVRYLPTISSASSWAHKSGYCKTVKTIMAFLWNENLGLRDIWFSGVG